MTSNSSQNKARELASGQSFSLAYENTASNTKELVDYVMITPYFVNDPITKFDLNKIEEYMNEKYKIDNSVDRCENRIFLNNNKNIFESLGDKGLKNPRRYFINSSQVVNNSSLNLYKSEGKSGRNLIFKIFLVAVNNSNNEDNLKLERPIGNVQQRKIIERYDSIFRYTQVINNIS